MSNLRSKINELRIEASRLKLAADTCVERKDFTEYDNYRSSLEAVEQKIDELLIEYIQQPDCPFPPCTGKMEVTPTRGVLICSVCKGISLMGRYLPPTSPAKV